MRPPPSTPWPTILHPQFPQVGANAWMAHSKLSKVRVVPATVTSNDLSYSFPHTSQRPMLEASFRTVELEYPEVVSQHRERDVEDGNRADVPLECSRVPVTVNDQVGCMLRDRPRQA